MKKVLIVGGVAGGASTATRLRRLNKDLNIIIFEKGRDVSFANCGLPYHIGGVTPKRESIILYTPEELQNKFQIEVRTFSEVIAIDSAKKFIKIKNNEKEYLESYDYLVLSPGARPIVPPIPGISNKNTFTLKNVVDMDNIINHISTNNIKKAIVVGGGFIGIEVAENLVHKGISTTIIEGAPSILAPFDSEVSKALELELIEKGVTLHTNKKVIEFKENNDETAVLLETGESFSAPLIVLAIGVSPDTKFLQNSGILLGERGHILVDDNLMTNIEDVYALGDAILINHLVSGEKVNITLAGPANREARVVAGNINGGNLIFKGGLGSSIIKVFDLVGGATGLNERSIQSLGIDYEKVYLLTNDHASYYPNATPLSIKMLFNKDDNKVLGAQAIGMKSVDKFIDIIATAISFGGTIYDLGDLDLSYSPPFSGPKSPTNIIGYLAQNLVDKNETQKDANFASELKKIKRK